MLTILGGGAIGLFLSALLSEKNNVKLITRTTSQSNKINSEGIYITGLINFHTKNLCSLPFNSKLIKDVLSSTDILIICLKSYDTENVLLRFKDLVLKDTIIITVQNGLGNKEIIKKIFPKNKVIESVLTFGITKNSDNRIIFCGKGNIIIPESIKKEKIFFKNSFGIKIKYVKSINYYIWEKFIINCAINALGSILKTRNGELIKYPYVNIMKQITEEAVLVAKRYNIKFSKYIFNKVEKVCLKTRNNFNSMLQDILKQKYITEIDFLNGKLLSMAQKSGLYLPANETIYELIKNIEETYKVIYGK